ncbi:MAG: type II toxin-antitoxin system VapC family toxin [Verrucomicrobia bacterium]|nr:type II toxin-antitoxin system VapC family toxin [Verrucomicrobiota bacterium]
MSQLLQGTLIYLDVNVFIYALEGYPKFEAFLTELFKRIDNGEIQAVTSELTLAESLVKPMMDGNSRLEKIYLETIQSSQWLQAVPVSRDILISAARLRSNFTHLRLPDAIHLTTAKATQCQTFLTNDKQMKNASDGIQLVLLSEIVL